MKKLGLLLPLLPLSAYGGTNCALAQTHTTPQIYHLYYL